jgi:hypothetical protein
MLGGPERLALLARRQHEPPAELATLHFAARSTSPSGGTIAAPPQIIRIG